MFFSNFGRNQNVTKWKSVIWPPFWNSTLFYISCVYIYGEKIIEKFRWESGFLWGVPWNPPLCTNGSEGGLMQLGGGLKTSGRQAGFIHTTRDQKLWTRNIKEFRFLGVGGNRSARRKPTKAGWNRQTNLRTFFSEKFDNRHVSIDFKYFKTHMIKNLCLSIFFFFFFFFFFVDGLPN